MLLRRLNTFAELYKIMNLFNGYCYETITEAANAEISGAVLPASSGSAVAVEFNVIDSISGTLQFNTSDSTSYSIVRVYPSCSSVGYQHNFTGLTLEDATITSWSVFAVFAVVWGIKILRRGL